MQNQFDQEKLMRERQFANIRITVDALVKVARAGTHMRQTLEKIWNNVPYMETLIQQGKYTSFDQAAMRFSENLRLHGFTDQDFENDGAALFQKIRNGQFDMDLNAAKKAESDKKIDEMNSFILNGISQQQPNMTSGSTNTAAGNPQSAYDYGYQAQKGAQQAYTEWQAEQKQQRAAAKTQKENEFKAAIQETLKPQRKEKDPLARTVIVSNNVLAFKDKINDKNHFTLADFREFWHKEKKADRKAAPLDEVFVPHLKAAGLGGLAGLVATYNLYGWAAATTIGAIGTPALVTGALIGFAASVVARQVEKYAQKKRYDKVLHMLQKNMQNISGIDDGGAEADVKNAQNQNKNGQTNQAVQEEEKNRSTSYSTMPDQPGSQKDPNRLLQTKAVGEYLGDKKLGAKNTADQQDGPDLGQKVKVKESKPLGLVINSNWEHAIKLTREGINNNHQANNKGRGRWIKNLAMIGMVAVAGTLVSTVGAVGWPVAAAMYIGARAIKTYQGTTEKQNRRDNAILTELWNQANNQDFNPAGRFQKPKKPAPTA